MDWRRLIELRVFPAEWVLTPSFPETVVRLSYPFNQGCQGVLASRSPEYYPVQLNNVRSFSIKSEADIFDVSPTIFPSAGLAFRAIPRDYRQQGDIYCRVLIEVADKPPILPDEQEQAQNELLIQHTQEIAELRTDLDALNLPTVPQWQALIPVNGWTDFGDPVAPVGFCVDALNTVYLRGLTVGTGATDATMFVLPVEARPLYRRVFPVVTEIPSYGINFGRVDVLADGSVQWIAGGNSYISLDGIVFKVGS